MPSSPSLNLPAALIRVWPGRSASGARQEARALALAERLADLPGFARISQHLFAALPVAGRVSVFDLAVRWSLELRSRLARGGLQDAISNVLIFPGQIVQRDGTLLATEDFLLRDFDRQPPDPLPEDVFLTGYAARWLRGRYRVEQTGFYSGPSGRRVPLYRVAGADTGSRPWHNPEILGRQLAVPRPTVTAILEDALSTSGAVGGLRVRGAFGVGKSHAIWHFLDRRREPRIWIDIGRALPGTVIFAERLMAELARLVPGLAPDAGGIAGRPPQDVAGVLARALEATRERLGVRPWVVCDVFQTVTDGDLEALAGLAGDPDRAAAGRFLLISRTGLPDPPIVAHLPEVELPPLAGAELDEYQERLFAGLAMDDAMISQWLADAAGNPLLLEESLVGLVHAGRIRRVYGSFFFAGGDDFSYVPSQRLVRHVEAEARRLGEPLPLRILAASRLAVPAGHLELAAARYGVELAGDWQRPYRAAGWLRDAESTWGPALELTSPILARAFDELLTAESAEELRHTLGQVLVADRRTPTGNWQAYRLLAGSPEALTPLLDYSQSGRDHPSRGELFEALWQEWRLQRGRGGDPTAELDLLWALLPLAHRLGRLHELDEELRRALELAADRPRRRLALLALRAELELEKGRFQQAEAALREALASSEGIDENRRAAIFVRLGDLLVRGERLREARELFESLLEIVKAPDSAMAATCHFHLGNVALRQNNLDDALDHHQEACRIRGRHKPGKPLGMSLSALGSVQLARGDFPKALHFYREAEAVLAEHQGGAELALAQRGAGRALSLLGDHQEASKLLRRALEASTGRDIVSEALARLEVAANQLELGSLEPALAEARQSHFQLSLTPETAFLGDAEQLLGHILSRQQQRREAIAHLAEARRLHLKYGDREAAAVDVSLLLDLAVERGDAQAVRESSAELEELLAEQQRQAFGEVLYYRLYKALDWLRRHQSPASSPEACLRRAFQELIRKTSFLTPEHRHVFLYQIREHQELLDTASRLNLTFPGL